MAVDTAVFLKKLKEKKEREKKQRLQQYVDVIIIVTRTHQAGGRLPAFIAYRQPIIKRRYDVQAGAGIGKVFGSLFKFLLPLVKKGGRSLGKHALHTGMNIVHDVLSGEKLKEAAKHRVKETGNKIVNDVKVKIDQMTGSGGNKRQGPPAQSIIRKSAKIEKGRGSSATSIKCTSDKLCKVKNHHFFKSSK